MGGMGGMGGAMTCMPAATDYPGDGWAECISDDGTWHLSGESPPSSIARVASFETIAGMLWRKEGALTAQDFLNARIEYTIDQGLDSRVTRRYDAHLDRPAEGVNCRGETHGAMYPDYCVGPGKILPLITRAFADGSTGMDMPANAARVEAALLWFLHVSTYKEAYTCKDAAKDCDSAWAYYGGGETAGEATGLAAYVKASEPGTHFRLFDALLGVRCWRDLDRGDTAMNSDMHTRTLGQLDRGLNRAMTVLLIVRLNAFRTGPEAGRAAAWAFLQVLGPTLDRAARLIDPEVADRLIAAWRTDGMDIDAEALVADLNGLFPCP